MRLLPIVRQAAIVDRITRSELLFIGGRSGVKTAAAIALHELLAERSVEHAVIEGDFLDLAHPVPHVAHASSNLAERAKPGWSGGLILDLLADEVVGVEDPVHHGVGEARPTRPPG